MTPDEIKAEARSWGLGRATIEARPWFRTPLRKTEIREVRFLINGEVIVEFWLAANQLPPCYQCFMRPANVSGHDLIGWIVYGLKPGCTEFQTVWVQSPEEGFEAIENFLRWAIRDSAKHRTIAYEGVNAPYFGRRGATEQLEHWDTPTDDKENA
jgi:hypothetical protein